MTILGDISLNLSFIRSFQESDLREAAPDPPQNAWQIFLKAATAKKKAQETG